MDALARKQAIDILDDLIASREQDISQLQRAIETIEEDIDLIRSLREREWRYLRRFLKSET